jgi:hypothetical protein
MEPVMTQSENSLASYWSNFVTADGWSYTLGRLALGLAISILLFPFGYVLILLLWANGMDWTENGDFGNAEKNVSSRLIYRLLAIIFIFPSLSGASIHLLSQNEVESLGRQVLSVAGFSVFPSSLPEWVTYYSSSPIRGTKYVVTVTAAMFCFALLSAEYMRKLRALIVEQAKEFVTSSAKLPGAAYLTFLGFAFLVTPFLFGVASVHSVADSGMSTRMGSPALFLVTFTLPVTIFLVGLLPIGAYGLLKFIAVRRVIQARRKSVTVHLIS